LYFCRLILDTKSQHNKVALIKSISGIRGTIGGKPGDNLTPLDIVKFAAAYGKIMASGKEKTTIVVGRDGRISGAMVQSLVVNTLTGLGTFSRVGCKT